MRRMDGSVFSLFVYAAVNCWNRKRMIGVMAGMASSGNFL